MADPSASLESRLAGAETRIEELAGANARLRRVIEDAAERHEAELAAERAERRRLELEVAELRRRVGMDSTNSSVPPSKEPIGAKAERKARQASERVRSKEKKPGGQPGHQGSGLARAEKPDRSLWAGAPTECSSCQADLAGAEVLADGWAQVWDVLPVVLEKIEWALPRRRCGCCGKVTTASVPCARSGCVSYGPFLNAAAVLLAAEGNVPVERAAMLVEALLGVPVSAGFVARAFARLADGLDAAGFDEAMRKALAAEDVLTGDESPVNVLGRDLDEAGKPLAGSPYIVTVRTPVPGLVWFAAMHARSSAAIHGLEVLSDFRGYLVRDDYAGWHQFDGQLAGVQQCGAHIIRHLRGVVNLDPKAQAWAGRLIDLLREALKAVDTARAAGQERLDPDVAAGLRARYDAEVARGQLTNMSRAWKDDKNHPGLVLANRLAAKADQIWLFTHNFKIPFTNNASEQALRGPKRHQAVSGYWHTPATLAAYCRVRSYLTSTRDHGIRALDAIALALAGRPWLPVPRTTTPTLAVAA